MPALTDEITLIPTPGHSPGHMSIHISSDGEEGLLTGDVAHHPCQMAHLGWSSTADCDPRQSAETRQDLFSRFADKPVLVIGGHFNAGHIKREGDAFKFIALTRPSVRSASSRVFARLRTMLRIAGNHEAPSRLRPSVDAAAFAASSERGGGGSCNFRPRCSNKPASK